MGADNRFDHVKGSGGLSMVNTADGITSAKSDGFALAALALGAIAIGASPIFVRLADVGPFAAAFWRVALAIPALAVWALYASRKSGGPGLLQIPPRLIFAAMVVPGLFFAGDLIFWHLSILNTTVTNATLFANFSPVIVTIGAWTLLGERIGRGFVLGLGLSIAGAALLMGSSIDLDPDYILGDIYGLVTALFFGSYVLAVRAVRHRISAASLMLGATIVTALALLLVSLIMGDRFWPRSLDGWMVLAGLALISHAGGQGLLAFALGHLPASFSSLVILIEPVAAAILGWLILAEAITPLQALGGAVILAGVIVARRASR